MLDKYTLEQLDLSEDDPHYAEAQYVLEHDLSLIDFDWWTHVEDLLGFPISFDDYSRLDKVVDGDLMELTKDDALHILAILASKEKKLRVWTVAIFDLEDPTMDIWISSFSSEKAADDFMLAARQKLMKYGVDNIVKVCKDSGTIDSDEYLGWLDARYDELEETR